MIAKPTTHAPATADASAPPPNRIAELNDAFRRTGRGGVLLATAGVIDLGLLPAALALVQAFDVFTPDNDPHGEHDFGVIELSGERMFWKLDYYDRDQRYASPDPADPNVTTRVLTIMLAREY